MNNFIKLSNINKTFNSFKKVKVLNNKHISNLFYTGQLTVPGPGVPPSIISGQIVADYILKHQS